MKHNIVISLMRGYNISIDLRGADILSDTNFNELDHTCGVSDEELSHRFKEAVRIENEIKKVKGLPIAKYDFEKKAPYVEYPDGRRVYAEEA